VSDLFVTDHTPALGTGRAARTYGIVRALAAHGPLDVVHTVFGAAEPDAAFRSIDGVSYHAVHPSRGAGRALAYARARAAGAPPAMARGVSAELAREAERRAEHADRIIADGPIVAATLRGLARPVIYNAHNLESGFRHSLDATGLGSPAALARFERGILERAAEAWMVSPVDIEGARALSPSTRLRLVPNVVDVESIVPVEPVSGGPAVFVASFAYEPNRRGLRFLLDEVLPRLPEARLVVAGAGIEAGRLGDRAEALGFVDDLRDVYGRAACAVVPLLEGGGSPLKFIEALAYGLPVVATGRAAAGLEARPGEHFLLGDGPDGFAGALQAALQGTPALGPAGRRLAEDRYSISALVRAVAP
jgi:glycosyltransferase involved in cell wall biosynthesis